MRIELTALELEDLRIAAGDRAQSLWEHGLREEAERMNALAKQLWNQVITAMQTP